MVVISKSENNKFGCRAKSLEDYFSPGGKLLKKKGTIKNLFGYETVYVER